MSASNPELTSTVVLTGRSLVAPLGTTPADVFEAVCRNEIGIGAITAIEQPAPRGGGEAPPIEGDGPRAIRYVRHVVRAAMRDAALDGVEADRIAIVLGSTLHGMRAAGRFFRVDDHREMRWFLASCVLDEAIEGLAVGPIRLTTCAACSSGLSSVGLGMTLLRAGLADVVIAGGYDTSSEYAYAGFDSLRLVSPGAVRPFGATRDGMKVSEGYAALVLEREVDARRRGVDLLATIAGYGESADAFHLTMPRPDGSGAAMAIRRAMEEGSADTVDMISAHATATPNNDLAEAAAYRACFGEGLASIPVTAFKGHLGHTLGGAGAVELVLSHESIRTNRVAPTPGADDVDPGCAPVRLLGESADRPVETTMNLSLGFGGSNACVVMRRSGTARAPVREPHEVVITGVGLLVPGRPDDIVPGAIDPKDYQSLLHGRRARRLSVYSKLTLATVGMALEQAGLDVDGDDSCGVIMGTTHGATAYAESYYEEIVRDGMAAANPMHFAEGVPNAGAAHVSLAFGCRGGSQAIIGARTAGLEALVLGALRVREGRVDRCIVGAGEEYSSMVHTAHVTCGTARDPVVAEHAIAFVLERGDLARARGAVALAGIESWAWAPRGGDTWTGVDLFSGSALVDLHTQLSDRPEAEVVATDFRGRALRVRARRA